MPDALSSPGADSTSAAALDLRALTRTFAVRGGPHRIALDAIDLTLAASAVHGLLGPNGAGKTTLCKIASTVLLPTSGSAHVLGHDVVEDAATVRRLIGIVFGGERGLYGRLTALENLQFWCAMHGLRNATGRRRSLALLERVGLGGRAREKVETFSRGMKQRLHLARGLVSDPPVLLLDEPTVGMDPVSARDFRDLVGELRGEGRTILVTTHDMAEAEAVCDTVTFIDAGTILGTGSPATVRTMIAGAHRLTVHEIDDDDARSLVRTLTGPDGPVGEEVHVEHDQRAGVVHISAPDGPDQAGTVLSAVLAAGHTSISSAPPSLEQVYLDLLGTGTDGSRRGMDVQ